MCGMESSFDRHSALWLLISEAEMLQPDYSMKGSQLSNDAVVTRAPDRVGKLFALRKRYEHKAADAKSDKARKSNRAISSLISNIIAFEIDAELERLEYPGEVVLRKNGNLVAVACRKAHPVHD